MKEQSKIKPSRSAAVQKKMKPDYDRAVWSLSRERHTDEQEEAKKLGLVKVHNPEGWLPKDKRVVTEYLSRFNNKNLICPKCKQPLVLRYEYLIVQGELNQEAFFPVFVCNNKDGHHAHHYKIECGKLVPFE